MTGTTKPCEAREITQLLEPTFVHYALRAVSGSTGADGATKSESTGHQSRINHILRPIHLSDSPPLPTGLPKRQP